jgi:NAD(P)-dependent dehydrogenase (short-subunit alcohol dehydrogenase family)
VGLQVTGPAIAGKRGMSSFSRPGPRGRDRRIPLPALLGLARTTAGVTFLYRAAAGQNRHSGRQPGLSPAVHAILGVRQLAQALASIRPTTAVLVIGAEVDAVHAASMAAAALLPRPWRRAALLDGLLAGSMAAAGLAAARAGDGTTPEPASGRDPWLRWRDGCAARLAGFLAPGWPPRSGRPRSLGGWGTMAALSRMRPRDRGSIVNVGSALGIIGIPLQAAYCSSKFACRGFFESVRAELLHEGSAVRMSMVYLPAVNTPQFDWCKTTLKRHPQPVPPIYQPELIAKFILEAAPTGRPEKVIGSWNKLLVLAGRLYPAWGISTPARCLVHSAHRRPDLARPARQPVLAGRR